MWRFLCIYQDLIRVKWGILPFSIVLQIASIVIGSLGVQGLTVPAYFGATTYQVMIYFESVTLSHNLSMTCLIVGRLLISRYKIRKVLGSSYGQEYTSIAAMLVESQGILVIAQVVLIAFGRTVIQETGRATPQVTTVYPILAQLQVLAPVILIYRVMQGKACDTYTMAEITRSIRVTKDEDNNTA
ncbi:hypothetical protein BDQ17DRAFT_1428863 [Cyathus striatus]|nr:hypothetical protein BDQ17DRAFT_1428863 [Cyathus striatus]